MEVERQVNDRSLGKERASPCEEGVVGRERSRQCRMTAEIWRVLEAEDATVYVLRPQAYSSTAPSLGMKWALGQG
jgi:hypothetical protein